MRRISTLITVMASLTVLFSSCVPEVFSMRLQMRRPSLSGYDFSGKTMAVVYAAPDKDTVIARRVAEGFAASLEEDYFGGNQAIGIYSMNYIPQASYSSRDTLLNLVMDTGADVVFLFDSVSAKDNDMIFTELSSNNGIQSYNANVPLNIRLNVYDSMGQQDTVRVFAGNMDATIPFSVKAGTSYGQMVKNAMASLSTANMEVGGKAAERFLSTWVYERQWFYYYDSGKWSAASQNAYDFKWHKALETWLEIVESSPKKEEKSMAAFNLASANYILGDVDLALEWLDMSDKLQMMDYSNNLRMRILGAKNRK